MNREEARRTLNYKNKKGYSKVIVHHESMLCKNYSPYGLITTKDINEVTCLTCLRCHKKNDDNK